MAAGPALSVVVVTYGTSALAHECVASVVAQRSTVPGGVEVVVVDSGSSPAERARLDGIAADRLLDAPGSGYAGAVNRGAAVATGRYLLMSNADVLYLPGALQALLDAVQGRGAVGPAQWWDREQTIQLPPTADERPGRALAAALDARLGDGSPARWARRAQRVWDADAPVEVDGISGASLLVPTAVFDELGGMDEGFDLYFEDTDLCRRIRATGRRLAIVPAARAVHHYNQSAGHDPAAASERFARSAARYARKHDTGRTVRAAVARAATVVAPEIPEIGEAVDLGPCGAPPSFTVEGPAHAAETLFLLSPVATCIPAAGARRPTGELHLPAEIYDRLAPGVQHVVALRMPGRHEVARWRWEKPPTRLGEAMDVRDCRPDDVDQVTALFAKVFGHEMSADAWRWKYLGRPDGWCSQVALVEGRIVCHVGGRCHRLVWNGEVHVGVDVGDVMSDPEHRGRGLWQATAGRLFGEHVDGGRALLVYGFPGEHVRPTGEALQAWEAVAPVHVLEQGELDPPPHVPTGIVVGDEPPPGWDRAWAEQEPDYTVTLRRDAAYLRWRYTERPDREYRFLGTADGRCCAVLGFEGEQAHLMELMGREQDAAALARLVLAAERVAADAGAVRCDAWFPTWSVAARVLVASGWLAHDAPHYLECTRRDERIPLDRLADGFLYSFGDWDVP